MTYQCPDCRNEFVQPFKCTTCGAQKLYDTTMNTLAANLARAEARLAEAVLALQTARRVLRALPATGDIVRAVIAADAVLRVSEQ